LGKTHLEKQEEDK